MELKPCPFCGGDVEEISFSVNGGKRIITGTLQCRKCSARFTIKAKFTDSPITAFDAAWNRRVGDDLAERMEDDGK